MVGTGAIDREAAVRAIGELTAWSRCRMCVYAAGRTSLDVRRHHRPMSGVAAFPLEVARD